MKGIIIYKGKYGATEQYATWLADALKLIRIKTDIAAPDIIAQYDVVIMGSSIYVGQLVINKWLKQHSELLSKKKLFLFVVSGSTTNDELLQQQVLDKNLDPLLRDKVKVFFLPGRCRKSRLSWKDRIVLKMGAWLEKDPQKKRVMENGFDNMDKKALDLIIEAVGQ
jgi:menaquinone-dependent protoporphyrinogen IX oxidase